VAARDIRAAKRYATALFEAAQKNGAIDDVERDIDSVLGLMHETPALRQLWESPLVPAGRKRDVVSRILGESLHPLTLSFLRLLVDKRREEVLESVQLELRLLADRARHLLRAEATFAIDPTPQERDALQRSLQDRTGENIQLTVHVDPEILGGVIVRMQDTIIDGSVRGTLERLREQLLQEA
jgi:F-type H+-transporting ATPase subunit delta